MILLGIRHRCIIASPGLGSNAISQKRPRRVEPTRVDMAWFHQPMGFFHGTMRISWDDHGNGDLPGLGNVYSLRHRK